MFKDWLDQEGNRLFQINPRNAPEVEIRGPFNTLRNNYHLPRQGYIPVN
jgi:hypothetical protein